jgi:hypothetical protein
MADEDQSTEAAERGAKEPRGLGSLAMRDVRRARRLVADAKGAESIPPEATLLLGIASALALLDLAAAIREHNSA